MHAFANQGWCFSNRILISLLR
jgi:hypothetical protein